MCLFFCTKRAMWSILKYTLLRMSTVYSPFINELREKMEFEGPFLVKVLSLHLDKNGKAYLNVILMDRSGEVEARVWDNAQRLHEQIKAHDIVRIAGKVNLFQGKRQVIVEAMEKVAPGTYPLDRFTPSTVYAVDRLYQDMLALMESMEDAFARKLALNVLQDPAVKAKLLRAPAAKSVHHAYAGGLLEHALSVCRILDFLGHHYRNYYGAAVNRDLLLLGGLFHDIGKIEELSFERATEYTKVGQLIGHLVLGCELIDRFAAQIEGFPEDLRLLAKHQVLAHHGKLEYGSPKLPHTVEALIVHMIDDLDSKVNSILGIIGLDNQPGEFTSVSRMYERPFLKPKTLPKFQGPSPGVKE